MRTRMKMLAQRERTTEEDRRARLAAELGVRPQQTTEEYRRLVHKMDRVGQALQEIQRDLDDLRKRVLELERITHE